MSASETQSTESGQYHTINEKDAGKLKDRQPEPGKLNELEQKMKGLGNGTRLKILSYVSKQDLCVHDLSALLEMSQSAVSHQLKELHTLGILTRRKEGRVVYYSLDAEELKRLSQQLDEYLNI